MNNRINKEKMLKRKPTSHISAVREVDIFLRERSQVTTFQNLQGVFFPARPKSAGPTLYQRCAVRRVSGRFKRPCRELDRRSQWWKPLESLPNLAGASVRTTSVKQENKHSLQLEVQTARPGAHDVGLRMQQPVWNGRPHVAQLRTDCTCLAVCSYTTAAL